MASASALGIGVLGTVAYSMWFNHDQRVYTEAMASARRTLGIDQPVIAAGPPAQTLSSGVVQPPPTASLVAAHSDTTALADNPPADTSDTTSLGPVAVAPVATAATVAGASQDAASPTRTAAGPASQTVAANRPNRGASGQPVRTAQAKEAARHRASRARAEPGLFARVGAFFHRVSYRRNATSGQREEYSRP
ncbi:hypothetical protein [Caballeronia sp. AZ10_KS36]|uniref:hypothetical protein n=1 Tax=Caballeronia sp. AZ10_KS36 TaxID=2921757 RepID=UPI002028F439|nr:hypothetical protein [Caballeronia sp. AZ10_KS36]